MVRLDDTAALVRSPFGQQDSNYSSTHVRKIDNGFLIRHDNGTNCSEIFSKEHPSVGGIHDGRDPMKAAVDFMNKK
jgi:hypothetical protein